MNIETRMISKVKKGVQGFKDSKIEGSRIQGSRIQVKIKQNSIGSYLFSGPLNP